MEEDAAQIYRKLMLLVRPRQRLELLTALARTNNGLEYIARFIREEIRIGGDPLLIYNAIRILLKNNESISSLKIEDIYMLKNALENYYKKPHSDRLVKEVAVDLIKVLDKYLSREYSIDILETIELRNKKVSNLIKPNLKLENRYKISINLLRDVGIESLESTCEAVKLGCGRWWCTYKPLSCTTRGIVIKIPRYLATSLEAGALKSQVTPKEPEGLKDSIMEWNEKAKLEVEVVSNLDHPNLLKLYAYHSDLPLLIYEYADYLTLQWQLDSGWRPKLQDAILIAIQVGDALRYMADRGLIHEDVKPSNVFFVAGVAKLGDFSNITKLVRGEKMREPVGTEGFRPPEYIDKDLYRRVSRMDMLDRVHSYQLANLFVYMLAGRSLDGITARSNNLKEELVKDIDSPSLRKLILDSLNYYPWERPHIKEIIKELIKEYKLIS